MEEGNRMEKAGGAMRMLVLWRDLWSHEGANIRTVTDLDLDDSKVWITVYKG